MIQGIYHRLYLITIRICALYLKFHFSISSAKNKKPGTKNVLALPSYPYNWPGAKERMANWKPFFEKDEIEYTVHWCCSQNSYLDSLENSASFQSFLFHCRKLLSRIKVFRRIHEFDVIYIQREAIPLYDSRYIGIEKVLIENHWNIVFDFYDADYEETPLVTHFIFNYAHKITVASKYLRQQVGLHNSNVLFTRLSLPRRIEKSGKNCKEGVLKIGWMGNPGNAKNLIKLDSLFESIAENHPEVEFHFVCRNPPKLKFKGITWSNMHDDSFDYPKWLESIDIGLVPYFNEDERTKAKTAMKSLEFWANSVAVICSKYGMSDKILHRHNCLIAERNQDWEDYVSLSIENHDLRSTLALNGNATFEEFHTYEANFLELKDFLFA